MRIILVLLLSFSFSIVRSQIIIGSINDRVLDFCFSQDGELLIVPFDDKIRIFETESFKEINTLIPEQHSPVIAVAINNSKTNVATCSRDSSLTIWNLNNGQVIFRFKQLFLLKLVKYCPNGSLFATVTSDNRIVVWDAVTYKPEYYLMQHSGDITDIEFLGNDKIISCSADHNIIIWEISTEKPISQWSAGHNWIRDLSINSSMTRLISCGDEGKVHLWNISDVDNVTELSQIRYCNNWLMSCDFYDNNTYVVSGHNEKIYIHSPFGESYFKINSYVNKVAFVPNKSDLTVVLSTQKYGLVRVQAKDMTISK